MDEQSTLYVIRNERKYRIKVFSENIGIERQTNEAAHQGDNRFHPKALGMARLYDGQSWDWELVAEAINIYEMELSENADWTEAVISHVLPPGAAEFVPPNIVMWKPGDPTPAIGFKPRRVAVIGDRVRLIDISYDLNLAGLRIGQVGTVRASDGQLGVEFDDYSDTGWNEGLPAISVNTRHEGRTIPVLDLCEVIE